MILKNVSVVEILFSRNFFFQKYLLLMVSFKGIKMVFKKDSYCPFAISI